VGNTLLALVDIAADTLEQFEKVADYDRVDSIVAAELAIAGAFEAFVGLLKIVDCNMDFARHIVAAG